MIEPDDLAEMGELAMEVVDRIIEREDDLGVRVAGEDLFGEVFVPMKTPLDARWDAAVPEGGRHTIEGALRRQEQLGRTVGLAIDLTKGGRYYDPGEWERHGGRLLNVDQQCCVYIILRTHSKDMLSALCSP